MSLPWQPSGLKFQANMGLGGGIPAPAPAPARTAFTGSLGNGGGLVQGNTLGPQTSSDPTTQLAGHRAGFSGSYGPPDYTGAAPGQSTPVSMQQMFNPYTGQYSFPQPPTGPTQLPPETWFQHGGGPSITQLKPFQQTGFANVTNKVAAAQPTPKPPEPSQNFWGGGFGQSDNSAWGNALGAKLETRNSLGTTTAANQPGGHVNQALPPGYGSVFGLGAGGK